MITEILSREMPLLENTEHSFLVDEWENLNSYLRQEEIRIAVLGPFNQGKSTLLNALLGKAHLPIDIVPTTKTGIFIRYGKELETMITLSDGQVFSEKGCGLLSQFAVFDGKDTDAEIKSAEVFCPHPILKRGVTLIDLPGTNDRSELETLVKKQLFSADGVIQILNARQAFTLDEEIKLREWIIEPGVQTVFLVLNFSNLLEAEQQKSVMKRAETIFNGIFPQLSSKSQLYRIDALPALRAQMKGDTEGLRESGLTEFIADLNVLVDEISADIYAYRISRINKFAEKFLAALIAVKATQTSLLDETECRRIEADELKKREASAFQKKLYTIFSAQRKEFNFENLRANHQAACQAALRDEHFTKWRDGAFKIWTVAKLALLTAQMNDISLFTGKSFSLSIKLPAAPTVNLPGKPQSVTSTNNGGGAIGGGMTGAMIGTLFFPGVGTVLGAALGGWFGNSVNKSIVEDAQKEQNNLMSAYNRQVQTAYETAGESFFHKFNKNASEILSKEEKVWKALLNFETSPVSSLEIRLKRDIDDVNRAVETLKVQLNSDSRCKEPIYQ